MSIVQPPDAAARSRRPTAEPAGPLDAVVRELRDRARATRGVVAAITSAIDGEGKTTIAHALARAIAASDGNRSVALFGAAMPFADFIEWQARVAEWRVEYRFLRDLTPTGGPDAADRAVSQLRREYPFAVLDVPSLLVDATAAVVANRADRVYLVVRGSLTPPELARQALALIEPGRFGGVILNDP